MQVWLVCACAQSQADNILGRTGEFFFFEISFESGIFWKLTIQKIIGKKNILIGGCLKELQPSKVSRIQIFSLQITMVIDTDAWHNRCAKQTLATHQKRTFACQRQRHRSLESLTLSCFLQSSGERPRSFFRSITSPVRRPTPEQLTCARSIRPSPCPIDTRGVKTACASSRITRSNWNFPRSLF